MDTRLEKALAFSNYRKANENRRIALARRLEAMMVVHYNNGMFKADHTTISFIKALIDHGTSDSFVLDSKNNPIIISDLEDFLKTLMNIYFAAMNEYADEMNKLAKARNVKRAMDWE